MALLQRIFNWQLNKLYIACFKIYYEYLNYSNGAVTDRRTYFTKNKKIYIMCIQTLFHKKIDSISFIFQGKM